MTKKLNKNELMRKSKSVTKPMATTFKKNLSSTEIISILKVCGEAQVTVLKFGDLYVRFGPTAKERRLETVTMDMAHASTTAEEIAELQQKESEDALLRDELSQKQDELAEMFVTDPVRAEELLLQGELEEDGSSEPSDG